MPCEEHRPLPGAAGAGGHGLPGAWDQSARRTAWDLIAVEKGHRLINMDAQAPNRIFAQWIRQQEPEITVHPEYRYGDSRLDFCLERPEGLHLVEMEGRDAGAGGPLPVPGRPHGAWCPASHELMRAVEEGHRATAFFVIQMADVLDFAPNDTTHPAFGEALREAARGRGDRGLHLPGDAGDGDAGRPRAGAAVTGYAIPLRRRCIYTMYQERMMLYEHGTYPEGVRFLTLPIYLGGNHHEQDHSHPGGRDPGGGGALLAGAARLSRTGYFPRPAEEDRAYFLDDSQYRAAVQRIHDREGDCCYYLLFRREGRDIGFALTALYPSEGGKCFVMEFCVLPEFRGGGTGTACACLLLDWAADRGAQYGELNAAPTPGASDSGAVWASGPMAGTSGASR